MQRMCVDDEVYVVRVLQYGYAASNVFVLLSYGAVNECSLALPTFTVMLNIEYELELLQQRLSSLNKRRSVVPMGLPPA